MIKDRLQPGQANGYPRVLAGDYSHNLRRYSREFLQGNGPTVLVVQARIHGRLEQEREVLSGIASSKGVKLKFINTLDPEDQKQYPWTEPEKLLAGVSGVIFAGSDMVNIADHDNQATQIYLNLVSPLANEAIKRGTEPENPLPVFGICLGHQMLHHTAGGLIENDKDREETGTAVVKITRRGEPSPYLKDVPLSETEDVEQGFKLIVGHNASVITPGEDFETIGITEKDPHSLTRRGGIITTQGHPEVNSVDALKEAFLEINKKLPEGAEQYAPNLPLEDTPDSVELLINFFEASIKYAEYEDQKELEEI
jgi:GMP synthase-like glutamine amidotransferase